MPRRKLNFENDKFYHIFDRGRKNSVVFEEKDDYIRALKALTFYQYDNVDIKLSRFLNQKHEVQGEKIAKLEEKGDRLVAINCYTLLPNSISLLLTQKKEDGISKFMSQFLNSYTRYFNSKKDQKGSLFIDSFKAAEVSAEKLLTISRHIHLLPFTKKVVSTTDELPEYMWSSFYEYLDPDFSALSKREVVLEKFDDDPQQYKNYVFNINAYNHILANIQSLVFK